MTFDQGLILLLLGVVIGGGIENRRKKFTEKQIRDFWRNQNEQDEDDKPTRTSG